MHLNGKARPITREGPGTGLDVPYLDGMFGGKAKRSNPLGQHAPASSSTLKDIKAAAQGLNNPRLSKNPIVVDEKKDFVYMLAMLPKRKVVHEFFEKEYKHLETRPIPLN
jgi:hypothetical protein